MNRFTAFCAGLAGGALLLCLARSRPEARASAPVRDAGPEQMRDPPPAWSDIDERSDESFPASDPPGTY